MLLTINNKKIPIKECISFKDRLLGLMFKKNISVGYLFKDCNSIHTFFMKENIDVLLLNKDNKILYIYKNLKPWKIILPKKDVYSILELPNNSCEYLKISQKIKIS